MRLRRLLCLTVAVLGVTAARAAAAPVHECTPTHGTVVAVDFAHWGGPIVRGCGVGDRTGYDLLHDAGFTTAGDQHDGPAFICRLGDSAFRHGAQYPTAAQEDCVLTPPASAYWSFWLAPAGASHWTYSSLGAMSEAPKPGEVELWTFGATNIAGTKGSGVPTVGPASLRPAKATPRPPATTATTTTTTTPTTRTTATTTTTTTTPTTTTPTTTTHTTPTTATHTDTTATSTTPAHATSTTTLSPPPFRGRQHHHRGDGAAQITARFRTTSATRVVAARPTSRRASSGSVAPLIIGVGLAVLLCAGAGRALWVRRREE